MITMIAGLAVIVVLQAVVAVVVIGAVTADRDADQSRPAPATASPHPLRPPQPTDDQAPPGPTMSTTTMPTMTPRPTPTVTRLAWRTETLSSGAQLLVLGDVDAVPRDPSAISAEDYHAAEERGDVKVVKVRGWWCVTKVEARLSLSAGYVRSAGFETRCSQRPGRMRQHFRFERSSWSGMRGYSGGDVTPWTGAQIQASGQRSVPCPAGRTGTYDYRLRVFLQIERLPVGEVPALSNDRFRGDCGTGVS
ncbi:hypothetical protein [Actinomadura alba]|nr:hypothetical protein [Actinomadura alba]